MSESLVQRFHETTLMRLLVANPPTHGGPTGIRSVLAARDGCGFMESMY